MNAPLGCIFRGISRNSWKTSKLHTSSSPQTLRFFKGKSSKTSKVLCNPGPRKTSKFLKCLSSSWKNLKLWGWGWGSLDIELSIGRPNSVLDSLWGRSKILSCRIPFKSVLLNLILEIPQSGLIDVAFWWIPLYKFEGAGQENHCRKNYLFQLTTM